MKVVKDLVSKGNKFDVVMTFAFFGNEVAFYLAEWLGAALVLYISDMYTAMQYADYAYGAGLDPKVEVGGWVGRGKKNFLSRDESFLSVSRMCT